MEFKKSRYILTNRLRPIDIQRAQPKEREYLLGDGGGLFLRIRPNGGKDWVFIYTFGGKRLKLGLGSAIKVSHIAARLEAKRARDCVAQCICPRLDRARRVADECCLKEAYLLLG